MTFLSVVIPTYNHDIFLPRAINSVLQQDFTDLEIIVVDNSSSDSTHQLVTTYYDKRVQYYSINNEGIISSSRNLGLSIASGSWICFMDSDDFWYPDKLSHLTSYLLSDQYDVLTSNEIMFNSLSYTSTLLSYGFGSILTTHSSLLLRRNCLSPSATLISKSFLDQYSLSFSRSRRFIGAEDYDFWLTLAFHNARFFFSSSVGGEYLIHGSNTSSRFFSQQLAILYVKLRHLQFGNYSLAIKLYVFIKHILISIYLFIKNSFFFVF